MNNKIVQLQTAEGRCFKVEGASKEVAAALIAERCAPEANYGGQAPLPVAHAEVPYGMPTFNFGQAEPVDNTEAESALAMPGTV